MQFGESCYFYYRFCNCIAATAIPILEYIHNKLRDYHLGCHMNHDLVPIYDKRGYHVYTNKYLSKYLTLLITITTDRNSQQYLYVRT